MSLPKIYIETTIPSYLTARRSRDLQLAADQQSTEEWWNFYRQRYDCYISPAVLKEVQRGDPAMAAARLEKLKEVAVLRKTKMVGELTDRCSMSRLFPPLRLMTRRISHSLRCMPWISCSLGTANISITHTSFVGLSGPAAGADTLVR